MEAGGLVERRLNDKVEGSLRTGRQHCGSLSLLGNLRLWQS